jgi:hypothetical protein
LRRELRQRKVGEDSEEDTDEEFDIRHTSRRKEGHAFVFVVFRPHSAGVKPSYLAIPHHKERLKAGSVEEGRRRMVRQECSTPSHSTIQGTQTIK